MNNNKKPNILVLMTDQQRWDTLGCMGNEKIKTPNLDRLSKSGLLFENAFTPTPVCVAARQSFIKGHRISKTHWPTNSPLEGPLPELPTIMTLLWKEGYWNQAIGKMHFKSRYYGFQDFKSMEENPTNIIDDDYLMFLRRNNIKTRFPHGHRDLLYYQPQTLDMPEEYTNNHWVAEESIKFLRQHKRYRGEQPFFLWSSWIDPHPPFACCEPYDSMYQPEDMNLPVNNERPLSSIASVLWGHRKRLDGAHRDSERIRRIRALYYGKITHVDYNIGRILDELERLGLADNTVVLFISDHGDLLADHGLSQKNCPYEPAVRIPFILRWPGKTKPAKVCKDLVGLTDFLPTLVEELGLEYPQEYKPMGGVNLVGKEGGGLAIKRNYYIIDYGVGKERWISLRTQTHKYVLFAADDGKEEFYNLEFDPEEINNIAEEEPELVSDFRKKVLQWERQYGLPSSFKNGEFVTYPKPLKIPSEEECRGVVVNEGPWSSRLPEDDLDKVETFAEAFNKAIRKETTLSPQKLSLKEYKEKIKNKEPESFGGGSLKGTCWEDEWEKA